MTQTYLLDGSGVTTVRGGSVELNEVAEGGRLGISRVTIEDADGSLDVVGHKTFRVHQDDCSVLNVFRGFVGSRGYLRAASERTEAARHIELELLDLNAKLGFKVIRGGAWRKRPRETIGERLTDLLASDFCNGIHDNGFVNYPDYELDKADLRGQFPGDVIGEMAEHVGFNWFIYWDEDETEASLWFQNSNTSEDWSSDLRISNDLAEIDGVTTFEPSLEKTRLTRSPERTVSGVWLPYKKGNVYRTRSATEDEFEPRDGTAPNANVKRRNRAQNLANKYLNHHSTEEDTITTSITTMPSDKINLIRAGQRLEAKFTHLATEGYGDFTWMRVTERTSRLLETVPPIYELDLVLKPQEEAASGGNAAIEQWKAATGTGDTQVTFDNDVTAGNTLVAIVMIGNGHHEVPGMHVDDGWTQIGSFVVARSPYSVPPAPRGAIGVYYKTAAGTVDNIVRREATAAQVFTVAWEISGVDPTTATFLSFTRQYPGGPTTYAADVGTLTGTGVALMGMTNSRGTDQRDNGYAYTEDTGWDEIVDVSANPGPFGGGEPWLFYAHALSVSGSIDATSTITTPVTGQFIGEVAGVAVLLE